MALVKLNKAITAAMEETALATVDRVINAFKAKFEMDDSDLADLANEIKEAIKNEAKEQCKVDRKRKTAVADGEKKKRVPTAYNLFIKDKMAQLGGADPNLKGKLLLKAAVDEWKKHRTEAIMDKYRVNDDDE